MEHYKSNLRAIREKEGVSQDQLAEKVGLNKKQLWQLNLIWVPIPK